MDQSEGLQNDEVQFVYVDRQNTLWLALNNGISRVEMPSLFTVYDEHSGFKGNIRSIIRHQGILYVATSLGIYYLKPIARQGRDGNKQRARFLRRFRTF